MTFTEIGENGMGLMEKGGKGCLVFIMLDLMC
jgi:hypothetical protein